ncbi:unnamed protein product [Rhizophagus irregularis]|nr:unnamed protein product [Rhizophagus irregularis]
MTFQLGQFVENGFLKKLFEKNPLVPMDKAALLVDMFGEAANPNNFARQAAVTNIQPTTLSLIFSIALYASSRSWDDFAARAYSRYSDMGDSESECPSADDEFGSTFFLNLKTTPKPVHVSPLILPDVEMTPVDQTVTPETSRKKDKQKARVTDDKQFWTTDLGGILVRWFPASWTLRERKQREKFQAVIHDIPEEMTIATLWVNRTLQVCLENLQELKWCRHSLPNLKKAPTKQKAKNVPDKKSRKSEQQSGNVNRTKILE